MNLVCRMQGGPDWARCSVYKYLDLTLLPRVREVLKGEVTEAELRVDAASVFRDLTHPFQSIPSMIKVRTPVA
jgi:hypothetical protein